jgi:hypothetical protein
MGFEPGDGGISPEFLLDATHALLAPFDRWIIPLAFGAPLAADAFGRFAYRAWELGMPELGVWRYGATDSYVFRHLGANPPGVQPL